MIKVFHGTTANFDKFDTAKAELGFHFAVNKEQAEERIHGIEGGHVKTFYLDIKNPYDIASDLGDWEDMEMLYEYFGDPENEGVLEKEWKKNLIQKPSDVVKYLKKYGYDGIVYYNAFEKPQWEPWEKYQAYIAFTPDQVLTSEQHHSRLKKIPEAKAHTKISRKKPAAGIRITK
jgi:hypothetical protein